MVVKLLVAIVVSFIVGLFISGTIGWNAGFDCCARINNKLRGQYNEV